MAIWREFEWRSDLPPDECRTLLESATTSDSFSQRLMFTSADAVLSSVNENGFRLFVKGPPLVRNSFEPYFYGRFEQAKFGKQTLIRGRFKMHPLVTAFMGVWFTLALLIGGVFEVAVISHLITGQPKFSGDLHPVVTLFFLPCMLAFGAALVAVGWRIGRGQRERITAFIETTFKAQPQAPLV